MNKEELNCYHKIFTIIRKTDLLNLDEKDELHLFLMKYKDENKQLKSLYETQTNFNKELLNKFAKKDRVLKELRRWLEDKKHNIVPEGCGINYNCEYDSEEDYVRAMEERSSLHTLKDTLDKLNELEGKNE